MSERVRNLKEIFPGAIGALDGTLIHAVVPLNQQARYRGRGRGDCFQNVLAMCDFNMIFTYVWAGWEGIAHDARVLREVAFDPNSRFPFPPPNKYYLCDAAYPNTRGFFTPYRNTRYWLADFRRRRAVTKEEKFNHAHAQLRNVIERAYGVLKARFPILKQMACYPYPKQIEGMRDVRNNPLQSCSEQLSLSKDTPSLSLSLSLSLSHTHTHTHILTVTVHITYQAKPGSALEKK
ncbi:hypothetical protein L6452_19738 [Arctium lappa]|uniref:Uncharacterized protein n=1 Tax=Arctium lappa TaxID=4217 RepID=A0ACB9BA91_ARCLA|nr:hypothetical protein L6452_19738 [Arctium lappa]